MQYYTQYEGAFGIAFWSFMSIFPSDDVPESIIWSLDVVLMWGYGGKSFSCIGIVFSSSVKSVIHSWAQDKTYIPTGMTSWIVLLPILVSLMMRVSSLCSACFYGRYGTLATTYSTSLTSSLVPKWYWCITQLDSPDSGPFFGLWFFTVLWNSTFNHKPSLACLCAKEYTLQ